MRIDAVKIKNEGQLIADYRKEKHEIMCFFDYRPSDSLEKRAEYVRKRSFQREQLARVLTECNQSWGADAKVLDAIERLQIPDSTVVVGGQQAGLLSGPLYTVNKVISILQFARQQEQELDIPVLPVFWIAGEDHDYEEINHIYLPGKDGLKKHKFSQYISEKKPVSEIEIDQLLGKEWIDELFRALPETIHTKQIYTMIREALERSVSFTDFFARLLHLLFRGEGLILLDAADERVRKLETDYFIMMIENQPKIAEGVFQAAGQLADAGYPAVVETDPADGHLFCHLNGERILLKRSKTGEWVGKQGETERTTEELICLAEEEPMSLSNNVITRPLMQELMLPTLAFIGGPGEISYWALLKPAFQALGLQMPPVVPRLSFTFISDRVKKALDTTGISIDTAIHKGSSNEREAWLLDKQEPPIAKLRDQLKKTIALAHQPIQKLAGEIRDDVGALADKNLQIIEREIDFLSKRMEKTLEEKYEKNLEQFDLIEEVLYPEGGFQERTWNILPLINRYGADLFRELNKQSISFQNQHYIVYI